MRTINFIVSRGWHELDDKQLRYLFGLRADDYSSAEIFVIEAVGYDAFKRY